MSYQLLRKDVLFYQRMLKSCGFYPWKLDGDWGPKTQAADDAFLQESESIKAKFGSFHIRSEGNILTLIPKAQIVARQFLDILTNGHGLDVRIISGTRSYEEQNALYRQGRYGNPGPRVTNARGGSSNHNFGLAWDIGIFENGSYITRDTNYQAIAPLVLPHVAGIEWGGNWSSFKDFPHYQLKAVDTRVAAVRNLFEAGETYA